MSSRVREGSGEPRGVRAELRARGLVPKRTLGQNFLADESLCAKIASEVCAGGSPSVLEIGAGLGALTVPLLDQGAKVVAVETDPALASALREKLAAAREAGQLQVLESDARELDIAALLRGLPRPRVLAGNLPYHLSGLLLRRAVDVSSAMDRSVFLLQLEVVDRLCAAPGTVAYGALSVFAQAVYLPQRTLIVRRGAFFPQPAVDSAVVLLTPLASPVELGEEFVTLVKAAFEKRRKTLRNAWRAVLGLSTAELEARAAAAAIDLGARGETLSVADFARMASELRSWRAPG